MCVKLMARSVKLSPKFEEKLPVVFLLTRVKEYRYNAFTEEAAVVKGVFPHRELISRDWTRQQGFSQNSVGAK